MSTATVINLAAVTEVEQQYLNGSSNESFFVANFDQYAAFALDTVEVQSGIQCSTSTVRTEIIREGDAICQVIVRIHAPGVVNVVAGAQIVIPGQLRSDQAAANTAAERDVTSASIAFAKDTTDYGSGVVSIYAPNNACARYCRFAPCMMIQKAEMTVGTTTLDTLNHRAILMYNELYVDSSRLMESG